MSKKSNKDKGLIHKYNVSRVDGRPVTWCFVLEDRDPLAMEALRTYAKEARYAGYAQLADDLVEKREEIRGCAKCEGCGAIDYDGKWHVNSEDACALCPACGGPSDKDPAVPGRQAVEAALSVYREMQTVRGVLYQRPSLSRTDDERAQEAMLSKWMGLLAGIAFPAAE